MLFPVAMPPRDDEDPQGWDDLTLARRCADRKEAAWRELLARHGGTIEAACRRTLLQAGLPHDGGALADAAAEVLRALLQDGCRILRQFRPGASLGAYLHVVAHHRTIDLARRRSSAPLPWLPLQAAPASPEALLLAAERRERLREALAALPAREAECLRLFHLEGRRYPEIAGRVGVPVAQLGVILSRARELLRERLGKDFGESL